MAWCLIKHRDNLTILCLTFAVLKKTSDTSVLDEQGENSGGLSSNTFHPSKDTKHQGCQDFVHADDNLLSHDVQDLDELLWSDGDHNSAIAATEKYSPFATCHEAVLFGELSTFSKR
jgi:hypothetical protein